MIEASIDTDRCGLNVRREDGALWFTYHDRRLRARSTGPERSRARIVRTRHAIRDGLQYRRSCQRDAVRRTTANAATAAAVMPATRRFTVFSSISCRPERGRGSIRLRQDVLLELGERALAAEDGAAELAVPAGVALGDEARRGRRARSAAAARSRPRAKVSMPPMWAWKQIVGLDALAAQLGVEVEAAGGRTRRPAGSCRAPASARRRCWETGRCPSRSADRRGWRRRCRRDRWRSRRRARAGSCGRRAWRGWPRC